MTPRSSRSTPLLLLLVLPVLAACQSSQPSQSTASVARTNSPTASVQASSPAAPVAVNFTCKLPISDGTPGTGGFITFPGAQFAADASSQVGLPGPGARGKIAFGLSYDRAYAKWLPVPRDWVSPDGSRYAYPSPDSIVVVSVTTGTIVNEFGKGMWLNGSATWQVVDLENGGVYAFVAQATGDPPVPVQGGLWVFPYAGAAHVVENTEQSFPIAVHGTFYYSIDYLSWIGSPYSGTNSIVPWRDLQGNGRGISFGILDAMGADRYVVVGVDSNGYVFAWLASNQLWYAKDNTNQHQLDLGGDSPRLGSNAYSILSDANGTWIAATHGLFLLTDQGLQRVADHTGSLAGSCT